LARSGDDFFGLFDAGDMPPFVGCAFAFGGAVGQAQQAWAVPFGVAGAAAFDLDQAESFDFAHSDGVIMDAELDEVTMRDGQAPLSWPPWEASSISILSRMPRPVRLRTRIAGERSMSIVRGANCPSIAYDVDFFFCLFMPHPAVSHRR
jgi:hypothetical protein